MIITPTDTSPLFRPPLPHTPPPLLVLLPPTPTNKCHSKLEPRPTKMSSSRICLRTGMMEWIHLVTWGRSDMVIRTRGNSHRNQATRLLSSSSSRGSRLRSHFLISKALVFLELLLLSFTIVLFFPYSVLLCFMNEFLLLTRIYRPCLFSFYYSPFTISTRTHKVPLSLNILLLRGPISSSITASSTSKELRSDLMWREESDCSLVNCRD